MKVLICKDTRQIKLMLLACVSFSLSIRSNYKNLREQFKKNCMLQYGLMAHDKYMRFIEPHIIKTEKNLRIHQFLLEPSDNPLNHQYFDCLLQYNLAYFHYQVNDCADHEETVKLIRSQLFDTIKKLMRCT